VVSETFVSHSYPLNRYAWRLPIQSKCRMYSTGNKINE
jgi:hypothetical protein